LTLPPAALVLSTIGLVRKQDTRAAAWGLAVSGLLVALIFVVPFVLRCLF
jgi:hypothetical protein